mgnify:CR=1 FL=1
MLRLLFILIFSFYLNETNAHDYKEVAHCDEIEEKSKGQWSISNLRYEFLHVINRTKIKDISFVEINFKEPLTFYSGINIKAKGTNFPLCFNFYTRANTVLIEERDLYDQIAMKTDKHLMFYFHTLVNCGNPCTVADVYSFSVNLRTLEQIFWGKTISENEYPSMWFVDKLSFSEAYRMHYYHDYDLYWRGKWYKVR